MLSNLISAACLLVFMGCCLTGLAVYFTFELLPPEPNISRIRF